MQSHIPLLILRPLAKKMGVNNTNEKRKELLKHEIFQKLKEDISKLDQWTDEEMNGYLLENHLDGTGERSEWANTIKKFVQPTELRFSTKRKLDTPTTPVKHPRRNQKYKTVFGSQVRREYELTPTQIYIDYNLEVAALSKPMINVLSEVIDEFKSFSYQLSFQTEFYKWKSLDGELEKEEISVWSYCPRQYINEPKDVLETVKVCLDRINEMIASYELRGSGWVFQKILKVHLITSKYSPMQGRSSYFPTPKSLEAKKCVINVQNIDNRCFLWSILSALHPVEKNPQRVSNYVPYQNEIDFSGLTFPIALDKNVYKKIRQQNLNLKFNVFIWNKEDGEPWELMPFSLDPENPNNAIDVLFIPHPNTFGHYVWLKDISRLVFDINKNQQKKFICRRCFCNFYSKEKLDQHLQDCLLQEVAIKHFPKCEECDEYSSNCESCQQASTFKFQQYRAQQKIPVYMIADFESFLVCINDTGGGKTRKIQQHIPAAYGIKVIVDPAYEHLSCFKTFMDMPVIIETATCLENNLSQTFLETVYELGTSIKETIAEQQNPLIFKDGEYEQYLQSIMCYICQKEIDDVQQKVPDHDHILSGPNYRGAAHSGCNINYNLQHMKIPIIFHNFKGYDSKYVLQQVGRLDPMIVHNLTVLAQNSEKFKSVTIGPVRFIDSLAHMNSSLANLVENLKNTGQDTHQVFQHMSREFPCADKFEMLLRKGTFPYQYLNCPQALQSCQLPPKDFFEKNVEESDYQHAQKVWATFNMDKFQDYMELYLKTDILLLADVLANYKRVTLENYGLDPLFFLSAPSLSLAAALKMTKVQLDLITDVDMYNFITKSVRGGLSYIGHRKSIANNKYINPNMSEDHTSSFIAYWDIVNLYGYAMMKPLPVGGFHWASDWNDVLGEKIKSGSSFEDVIEELDQQTSNYYLEVDAEFPSAIHQKMAQYPMLPERMISPGAINKVQKLINHLGPRKRYVLAYETYLLALQHGVVFNKIHRVLQYQQAAWLKPYIEFNTRLRQQAKDDFEKNHFKLMNNSVFGKLLEDVMRYQDFELFVPSKHKKFAKIHQQKPYLIQQETVYHRCSEHQANPDAETCTVYDGCVVGMQKTKRKVILNKPIFVGSKILELSKVHMFGMYYNIIQPYFQNTVTLCATDTDSFIMNLSVPDLYSELEHLKNSFDFSNYDRQHQLYSNSNATVPGKFKDEFPSMHIEKFIGLRPKCYAIKMVNGSEVKKAKGVKKDIIRKDISFEDYERALMGQTPITRQQQIIRSFNQQLYTIEQERIALSTNDDKRFICEDGISTLPWGHYSIM